VKYFKMDFSDSTKATEEVWRKQDAALLPHTSFHMSACGRDTSVWTPDTKGEELFRKVLNDLQVRFEEGDKQQVVTFLDEHFG
jgi:hypothetical protein